MSYEIPEKLVCDECGGGNVTEDATVRWDIIDQRWIVVDVGDYTWCSECDSETSAEFVPIDDLKTKALMEIKKEERDGIPK